MLNFPDLGGAKPVFDFFVEFSKVPRGSTHTSAIAEYLVNFAVARGLEYRRDAHDNVIIKKPATVGYEDRPTVVLQGHTDMVLAENEECNIDLLTDGLELYVDGDFLRARGTTLGGDDGVAMAYALALLDSNDIPHPAIEAVFTSDEEIGLLGAVGLDTSDLRGRLMLNIDSDAEGIFTVGCAGGMRVDMALPVNRSIKSQGAYKLTVSGFKGGHSGVEIDKGRRNAIKALAMALSMVEDISIVSMSGGNADNAIPRSAECIFTAGDVPYVDFEGVLKAEFGEIEEDMTVTFTRIPGDFLGCDEETSRTALSLINECPSGVIRMMEDIEGLVETSLNLGILQMNDERMEISFSVRSAVGAEKKKLADRLKEIAVSHGASYGMHGDYPAWEYRKESHLRDVMCKTYTDMYGKEPVVMTIHAGLECGIFSDKMEGLDCVSIGPDNFDIHTTEERLSISSTIRVWEYLLEVLKRV
jgi:dipeptidase D